MAIPLTAVLLPLRSQILDDNVLVDAASPQPVIIRRGQTIKNQASFPTRIYAVGIDEVAQIENPLPVVTHGAIKRQAVPAAVSTVAAIQQQATDIGPLIGDSAPTVRGGPGYRPGANPSIVVTGLLRPLPYSQDYVPDTLPAVVLRSVPRVPILPTTIQPPNEFASLPDTIAPVLRCAPRIPPQPKPVAVVPPQETPTTSLDFPPVVQTKVPPPRPMMPVRFAIPNDPPPEDPYPQILWSKKTAKPRPQVVQPWQDTASYPDDAVVFPGLLQPTGYTPKPPRMVVVTYPDLWEAIAFAAAGVGGGFTGGVSSGNIAPTPPVSTPRAVMRAGFISPITRRMTFPQNG